MKLTGGRADAAPAFLVQKNLRRSCDCPFCSSTGAFSLHATHPRLHSPLGEVLLWHLHLLCFVKFKWLNMFQEWHLLWVLWRYCVFQHTKVLIPALCCLPKYVGTRVGMASHWIRELCEREPSKIAPTLQPNPLWARGLVCSHLHACIPPRGRGGSPRGTCAMVEVQGWLLGSGGLS